MEQRPDTDERDEPGGTPSPGPQDLIDKPVVPGADDAGGATPVPGAYQADPGPEGSPGQNPDENPDDDPDEFKGLKARH